MKEKLSLMACLVLFLMVPVSLAYAGEAEKTIITSGVAMANTEDARRKAINDALRNAVEEGMGTFVTADLIVKKKQVVDEKILSRVEGYVRDYKIVEERESDGLYRVKITATVKLGKIQSDLMAIGLLMQRKQVPRLMVLVGSRKEGEIIFFRPEESVNSVRNIVEQGFIKKKFLLVDLNQVARKRDFERTLAAGNQSKIANLAKDAGAEVLVIGEAVRNFERFVKLYGSSYKFYRSEVQLRAIETGTGRVLFSGTKEGASSATLEPLREAAEALTAEVIEAVLQKWASDVSNTTTINLRVIKVDFPRLVKLEKALSNISGVEDLRRRSFGGKEGHLEVDYTGNSEDLAEKLIGIAELPIEITGMNQQTIDFEMIKP